MYSRGGGRVIPPADYDFLYEKGAKGIFDPGTAITDSEGTVSNFWKKGICKAKAESGMIQSFPALFRSSGSGKSFGLASFLSGFLSAA